MRGTKRNAESQQQGQEVTLSISSVMHHGMRANIKMESGIKHVRPGALNTNVEQSDASDVSGLTVVAMLDTGCAETVTVNMQLKLLQAIQHGTEFSFSFFAKTVVCVV